MFQQLTNNTFRIYKFIEAVFPKPDLYSRLEIYRGQLFEYSELLLVGHSEGGLLLRKVILEAAQRNANINAFIRESRHKQVPEPARDGMLAAHLRLFAPALGGDMQNGLLGIFCSLPVVSQALSASAAKRGMNQGSPSVTEARRQTDRYADYLLFDCFRAHIIWAERDWVVNSEKYAQDIHCINPPKGSTHTNVCKPNLSYLQPIRFVELGGDQDECR